MFSKNRRIAQKQTHSIYTTTNSETSIELAIIYFLKRFNLKWNNALIYFIILVLKKWQHFFCMLFCVLFCHFFVNYKSVLDFQANSGHFSVVRKASDTWCEQILKRILILLNHSDAWNSFFSVRMFQILLWKKKYLLFIWKYFPTMITTKYDKVRNEPGQAFSQMTKQFLVMKRIHWAQPWQKSYIQQIICYMPYIHQKCSGTKSACCAGHLRYVL